MNLKTELELVFVLKEILLQMKGITEELVKIEEAIRDASSYESCRVDGQSTFGRKEG